LRERVADDDEVADLVRLKTQGDGARVRAGEQKARARDE